MSVKCTEAWMVSILKLTSHKVLLHLDPPASHPKALQFKLEIKLSQATFSWWEEKEPELTER
jgi:hypothetical protein